MTLKLKLVIISVITLLFFGMIVWILIQRSSYKELNSKYESTCRQLSDMEAQNNILTNMVAQYNEAIKVKDNLLSDYTNKINKLNNSLKELHDEDAKTFLSIRTPDNVKCLLESTDPYKVSDCASTSSVSTEE